MKFKELLVMLLLGIAMTSFVACGEKQEVPKEPSTNQNVTTETSKTAEPTEENSEIAKDLTNLKNWEGSWGSMTKYLDVPEVDKAFEEVAAKENTTAEEVRKNYDEKRKVDFNGIKFEGDKVTFFEEPEYKDGNEITSATYRFKEMVENKQTWYIYEADEKDAKYPVLALMESDIDSGLHHFHMRYGASQEEVMAKDGWYPGFVWPDTTTEQIVHDILD